MRIRYTSGPDELEIAPAGRPSFTAKRGEWVDVDPEVAGKRPSGDDLGEGLLAQLDDDGEPRWELESTKKAQRTRAANESAGDGEEG